MPASRRLFGATVIICAMLLVLATGCVRSKPARDRDPLPTLPALEASIEESEAEVAAMENETAVALTEESGEGTEVPEEVATTPEAVEPTAVPTEAATPTPEPTPYTGPLYVVLSGDTLASIAAAHGSTVDAFMKANDLTDITLRVGQQLRYPEGVEPLWDTDVENTTVHVVQAGETLNDISARYRMPAGQIMALNTWLTDPNLLRPGDQVTVVVEPVDPNAIVYVVQAGDTLASIALQYGVSVNALAEANYIVDANRLYPGQQLVIP